MHHLRQHFWNTESLWAKVSLGRRGGDGNDTIKMLPNSGLWSQYVEVAPVPTGAYCKRLHFAPIYVLHLCSSTMVWNRVAEQAGTKNLEEPSHFHKRNKRFKTKWKVGSVLQDQIEGWPHVWNDGNPWKGSNISKWALIYLTGVKKLASQYICLERNWNPATKGWK